MSAYCHPEKAVLGLGLSQMQLSRELQMLEIGHDGKHVKLLGVCATCSLER